MRLGLLPRILRQITNGTFTPTLSSLALTNTIFPENTTAGTVFAALTGTTGGSTLTVTNTDGTRVAISGINITAGATSLNYEVDTNARSFQVTETLAGAVGSPKATTFNYTIGNLNDTNPSAFTFTDVTGVAVGATQTSNTITIAGLGASDTVTATLTGAASSLMSKNSGAFTAGPLSVANGDTIVVRHTSSASNSTAVNTTLTAGTTSDTFTSTTAASSAPVNSVAPAVTGTTQVGQVLTSTTGTWSGSPTYAYQWNRNGTPISAATSSTYTLVSGDLTNNITCTVTATNGGGSASAVSNSVGPVTAPGTAPGAPVLSATSGHVVGTTPITWDTLLDANTYAGMDLQTQIDDNSGFTSPDQDITFELDNSDFGGTILVPGMVDPVGTFYARQRIIDFSGTPTAWSNTYSEVSSPTAQLDNATSTRYQHNLTFSNTGTVPHTIVGINSGGGFYECAGANIVAATSKFAFEVTADTFVSPDDILIGIYNDTTDMSAGGYGSGVPGLRDSNGLCFSLFINAGLVSVGWHLNTDATNGSVGSGAAYSSSDKWRVEIDISGSAGTHKAEIFRNNVSVKSLTSQTLTGFNRAFIGVRNANKATINFGPTLTNTPTSGYATYA